MLQIVLGIFCLFIYPVLSKITSQILMGLAIVVSLVPLFFLYSDDSVNYMLINLILFVLAFILRYYLQKSKYQNDMEDWINSNKDKTD
jgi:multisubunit Na+/H+ antiporter MnhG subunit